MIDDGIFTKRNQLVLKAYGSESSPPRITFGIKSDGRVAASLNCRSARPLHSRSGVWQGPRVLQARASLLAFSEGPEGSPPH